MSSGIPHANIAATGPLTRGDFLMLLYWSADTRAVPNVRGIAGLARLTRLALILGEETGVGREITPFFTFHATPQGGVASVDVWTELLSLRAYQVLTPLVESAPTPAEERAERTFLLESHIPAHEREHYPMPTAFERDVLTNKGTFFAAKREDQMVERRIKAFQTIVELNAMPLAELTARASRHLRQTAAR
ncbi:MAG TPA: hypothetical protein VFU59_00565 [Candidatus Eisenbacteria bacterium]|nr:hypothetical protein [Candidatus Eisenbacteria bacterium]